jgi:YHS domain-containing protein
MNSRQPSAPPPEGRQVITACGARVMLNYGTPFTNFHGETVYFCGPSCLQLYEEDPLSSCLASRLLSEE